MRRCRGGWVTCYGDLAMMADRSQTPLKSLALLILFAIFLARMCGIAKSAEPSSERATAVEMEVQRVLALEASGDLHDRAAQLRSLSSAAAASSLAQWSMGNIRWGKKWIPFESIVDDAEYVLRIGTIFYGGNFAVRRHALERIGGFDTSIEFHGEDTNLGRRLSRIGNVDLRYDCYLYTSARRYNAMGKGAVFRLYTRNFVSELLHHRPKDGAHLDVRQ
jgi:hypothetical protein